jgi:hypothetical protein
MIYQQMVIGQFGNNDISGMLITMPQTSVPHFAFKSWVMLYNSNLDRSLANRKSKADLRKELKKWEDDMSRKKKVVVRDVLDYQV